MSRISSCFLLSALIFLTACVPAPLRRVRLDEVVSVHVHGTVGATVELRLTNRSHRDIQVQSLELQVVNDKKPLGGASLHIPVTIPARTTTVVPTRWKFHTSDFPPIFDLEHEGFQFKITNFVVL